jgi:hypothetical protein
MLSSYIRLGFPNGLFSSGFSTKALCAPLPFSIRVTCPAQVVHFDFITRIIFCDECRSLVFIMQHSSLPRYLSSLWPKYLPLYPIHIHDQPFSSFRLRDQVSHPHNTTDKIIVPFILIVIFFWKEIGRQKTLNRVVADISRVQYPLNFSRDTI